MTRIGTVKVKPDGKYYAPIVLQYIREDGERKLARFEFEQYVYEAFGPCRDVRLSHTRYRRAA